MNEINEQSEILAILALGALDETEAREILANVERDAALRAELDQWRETAAHLAHYARAVDPSDVCRTNILTAIKEKPVRSTQETKIQATVTESAQNGDFAKRTESSPKSNVVSFPARQTVRSTASFWNYVSTASAVAASVIAILLGVALSRNINSNNQQIAELKQQLANTEQKLNDTSARLDRERQDREMLASPSTIVLPLNGTAEMPAAKARLVVDRQTNRAMLFVEGLPDAPAGKAYQIWWMNDPTKPAPGATFQTTENGKGELRESVSAGFATARIYAVTLEPETGSPKPTGKPFLITPLS